MRHTRHFSNTSNAADDAALFKVPMIPASFLEVTTPLTVEITVAHDISIGNTADVTCQTAPSLSVFKLKRTMLPATELKDRLV